MIRVLFYLLLLEVCLADDANEPRKSWSSVVRDVRQTILAERTNSISTVIYYGHPGVPSFTDSINLHDGLGIIKDNVTVHYGNMSLYNLSSAYSLKYQIDLRTLTIETIVGLGNAQIQGRISVYPNNTSRGLLVNFYKMIFSYVTKFKVENGIVILEKTIRYSSSPYFGKTTVKSEIDKNLHSYLPTSLLETIKVDLYEEIRKKINLDDLRFQVQREIYYMYRTAISQRFKRTMVDAFKSEEIHSDIFNELHFDTTNYHETFGIRDADGDTSPYDTTIPSFRLRGKEELALHKMSIENISFAEGEVHLRGRFNLSSPRLVTTIVYSNVYWPRRENKTLDAEYQLTELAYIFGVVARLDTASVELKYTLVQTPNLKITLADDQAISDYEKLSIIERVRRSLELSSYIATNCDRTFRHFIDGILLRDAVALSDEMRVAYFGPPGVPSFPHSIHVDNIDDTTEKFVINYRNITIFFLSSAYSLKYKIDFETQKVLTNLTCEKMWIQGYYNLSEPSSPNKTKLNFAMNFHQPMFSYDTAFQIQNGTISFGSTSDHFPRLTTVKGEELTDISQLRHLSWKLRKAIFATLYEEVHQKINLDDVRFHIKRYIFDKNLTAIGERFKTTIFKVLKSNDFHSNIFDVFYFDTTNSTKTIELLKGQDYDVSIPSFTLQAKEKFVLPKNIGNITFTEDGVHLHSTFHVSSPRLLAKIVYSPTDKPLEEKKTHEIEYQLAFLEYDFRMFASLKTASVELKHTSVSLTGVTVANDPAPYNDERDNLIWRVSYFMLSRYINSNCGSNFKFYMHGIMADERIAQEIFKNYQLPDPNFTVKT